ncbi:FK506-binding protein 15-like isoform X1 [Rhineura floridana]|uniref:FK506-binding protein 15-like isoform X1 n=1 Tax=Rhineura floridana TaxID=261503 RepID=UPI002AC87D5E|nr:FK506-binding protein 15-like isoform X1 [Rhineura floridana]XP_061479734.1 FK506-binding protein 15-like isoform X1 [Rhineura floridana]XP_061479735.1 FK506-binding protein 15-like isoform X1 [Rhineura floridana]XP_061479736.1 FK506-binding protein 15-like isoform X1 [Rhineura floridana]
MENSSLSIESEYIKNLQQHIYFLELEANFLREQAKKATNLQPLIASETEHMLQKLQELQSHSDGFQLELKRKESGLNILKRERDQLRNQINVAEEHNSKEKQVLVEEIIALKRKKEENDRQISVKEVEILHAKQELEQQQMNLSNTQQSILVLQAKVKQRSEQQKALELQLSEKRQELLKVQSAMNEMEDKIFKKTVAMQEQITHDLRNEISFLHQQICERELLAEQDCFLRSKMVDDYAALTKENATLRSRLLELIKQTNIERALEESYTSHSDSIAQFLMLKDREDHLQREIMRHQELLKQENSTFQDLEDKITILKKGSTSFNLRIATMSSQVAEVRALIDKEKQDNLELKRDKALLVDLATNLQKQLVDKAVSYRHPIKCCSWMKPFQH